MAYRIDLTGQQVEEILNNALLKVKQPLTEEQKAQIKENLGFITAVELNEEIGKIKSSKVYVTEEEWDILVSEGKIDDSVEYNIYEEAQ